VSSAPGSASDGGPTSRLTSTEAIIAAIAAEMRRDPRVFLIGQDIGPLGGAMQGTHGLFEAFGPERVREAPISESAMVGAAIGAALFGQRPIVEVSFGEFLPAAMNQLINQAPNIRYMTGGRATVPVVIRTRVGDGPYGGHPHDYSAWFAHVPGLKVVMPATPSDAKGLMTAAIRDPNPVLFMEPMSLAHGPREAVPDGDVEVRIGAGRVARAGSSLTVVTVGSMVPVALKAAEALARESGASRSGGIQAEVIDLRSLRPWDRDLVIESVRRTGRLLYVQEAWPTAGFGAEVVATVVEALGPGLRAAARVGTAEVPVPSGQIRRLALPNLATVLASARDLVAR
jgi:pyruvate/2-oxoglutarate/acetoin dehydrogenase E1 component